MKCLPAKGGIKLIMPKTRQAKARGHAHKSVGKASGESKYFSRAVGKAIQILEMLSRSTEPISLSEMSRQTELTKSSAFRLLQTLETLHYIRRDGNGHYLPSNENVSVISSQYVNALVTAAHEPMRRLNMEFGETISLAVLMHNHVEVVHVVESANLIRMTNITGRILPPHASSMGKVVAAWQDADTRKRLLQSYGMTRYNENTIVDEQTIEDEYKEIRARGYSRDAEETTLGGCCFGAAIFSAPGKAEAAISLSMPKTRLPKDEERQQRIIQSLRAAADEISKKLARPGPLGAKVA
jgi:IclR family acetate operon transcriptional repressor